ncbi:MAG: metal-dependent hydrolase [Deltaproteobacteria bacterium]|nr:metal-dependent hydrolase [Deltaproteobacteria bacterium]
MASAFTHAVVGAALTPLAPPAQRNGRLAVELAALAALPDLDVLGFGLGIDYAHPLGHRGLTHSLLFAALLAPLVVWLLHRDVRSGSHDWWALVGLCFAATASHGVLDAFTDAGLGIGFFIPFDNRRYFMPWRPLATSPLEPSAFFSHWGLRVMANEIAWVWLPTAACVVAVWLRRRRRDANRRWR